MVSERASAQTGWLQIRLSACTFCVCLHAILVADKQVCPPFTVATARHVLLLVPVLDRRLHNRGGFV